MTDTRTKYFYADPLAAAWMAKHFGMKFCDKTGLSVSADPSLWYMAERHYQAGSLFIHHDSLHLLEIKQRDLIRWHNPAAHDAHHHRIQIVETDEPMHPDNRLLGIIQRDGKPFFWPESEKI